MSFLNKITDMVGGSLFKEIKETAMAYFPPDMNPEQRAAAELALEKVANKKEIDLLNAANEAQKQFDNHIASHEGTASDLKTIPYIGGLVIFLRGVQRPLWGFGTFWMDLEWLFSDKVFTETQEYTLLFINLLVLGFLFGERALKNLEPLIARLLDRKKD